jgi:hypothetical protein
MAWSHINVSDLWDDVTGVLYKMNQLGQRSDQVFIPSDELLAPDWKAGISTQLSPLSPARARSSLSTVRAFAKFIKLTENGVPTLEPNSFNIASINDNVSSIGFNLTVPVKSASKSVCFASNYATSGTSNRGGFVLAEMNNVNEVRFYGYNTASNGATKADQWGSILVLELG